MRRTITCWLLGCIWLSSCKDRAAAPAEIADQGWHAHDLVMGAGEAAKSCAAAGIAMQRVFAAHRDDFVAAFELDRDKARLQEATDFLEAHEDRYSDLETRMEALADRCATDPSVQAVFHEMETPE